MDNLPFFNLILASGSLLAGLTSWVAANMPLVSIGVTISLFFIGKGIDIGYKEYLRRRDLK